MGEMASSVYIGLASHDKRFQLMGSAGLAILAVAVAVDALMKSSVGYWNGLLALISIPPAAVLISKRGKESFRAMSLHSHRVLGLIFLSAMLFSLLLGVALRGD